MMNKCCHEHPDHSEQLGRLNRAMGQIDGVKKMIIDHRYCIDILTQLKAARAALQSVEANILEKHMQLCLEDVCTNGDKDAIDNKIAELIKIIKSYQ